MESICLKHQGVSKAYALRAGRYLMVYVQPSMVGETNFESLVYTLKKEIEENNITNKFQVEVLVYRTNVIKIKTEVSNNK
jgi:HD superfamily phosphodiesterase